MSVTHLLLGRNGDEILMSPVWHKIFQDTGEKVTVIVAREFAGVLRGMSYVTPDVVNGHWYGSVVPATKMAMLKYDNFTIIQCHGVGHATDEALYPSFGEAMWSKAGFPNQYGTLPMVFDRRNADREAALCAPYRNGKPIVLFNFSGVSSPLPCQNEIWARMRRYQNQFNFVSLAAIRARYIYDLLGLYDIAAGLISIDSSTSHLAAASKVPLLAYCRGGWSGMIPKSGAMRVEYSEAHKRLDMVDEFLQSLLLTKPKPLCKLHE